MIHKSDQPDIVVNLFNADSLAGEDLAEVDFRGAQTDSAAACHHDSFVVERVVDVGQSLRLPRFVQRDALIKGKPRSEHG